MDKDKELIHNPRRLEEVCDTLFVQENMCLYKEGLLVAQWSYGYLAINCQSHDLGGPPNHHTYLAVSTMAMEMTLEFKNFILIGIKAQILSLQSRNDAT